MVLGACALTLDLVSEYALVLDCSSVPHKVLCVNAALAHRLGYDGPRVVTEDQTIPVLVELEYRDTSPTTNLTNAVKAEKNGYSRTIFNNESTCFAFRSSSYASKFDIFILTEFDDVALMRLFFNGCDVMMGILEGDLEGGSWRHLYANDKIISTCKISREELAKTPEKRGVLQSMVLAFRGPIHQVIATKAPVTFEHAIPHIEAWGRFSFYFLGQGGADNRPLIGYVIQDITEQKAAEQKLETQFQREAELKTFFDTAPMQMAITDLLEDENDVVSILTNANHSHTHKRTPEQMMGTRYRRDLAVPDPEVDYFMNVYRSIQPGKPIEFEYTRINMDGEEKSYHMVISLVGTPNGNKRFASVLMDITAKKKIEEEIQKHRDNLENLVKVRTEELFLSEEKFRSLVNSAPNIILTLDSKGIIQYANRPIGDSLTLVGERLQDIFLEEGDGVCGDYWKLESNGVVKSEARLNTSIEKWFSLCMRAINKDLAVVVATDITEGKLLSDKLNKAMEAKSRFLANMSHEVRTPLSGIIGMSQLLEESRLTSDQAECVDTIKQCGEVLLTVINDILDFSKIEAVGLALCESEISFIKCMEDALYMVVPAANKKGLEVVLDVDADIPDRVVGDVVRIRQIMLNLLNNAVKFTDSGHVLVSIGAQAKENNKWEFNIRVKDTGCGVPPDLTDKVFQMFYQIDGSTTRKHGGTGIGLPYAKRLIESMGGRIWVESDGIPGKGSTFYFDLVLAAVSMEPMFSIPLKFPIVVILFGKPSLSSSVLQKQLGRLGFATVHACAQWGECEQIMQAQPTSRFLFVVDVEARNEFLQNTKPIYSTAVVYTGTVPPQEFTAEQIFLRKPVKMTSLIRVLTQAILLLETSAQPHCLQVQEPITQPEESSDEKVVVPPKPCSTTELGILVVEDNMFNQKLLKRIFSKLGCFTISYASNGKEALTSLEQFMPDLIIMDVQMPIMDGVECTQHIRQKYGGTWPHIIALTADVFPEDEYKCRQAGATDFLTKPLNVEKLKVCLSNCAHQKQFGDGNVSPPRAVDSHLKRKRDNPL